MTVQSNFPSIKPSLLLDFANTRALDPRITFTRTTTATYYDGKTTAKAEENLLTYSQQFDFAWTDASVTTTDNNSAAPDGTTTASLLEANASAARVGLSRTIALVSGVDYSISFFAKAGTHDIIQVAGASGLFSGNGQANFDLTNGVLGTVSGGTATITSVGNSWYRCTWVATSSGTSGLLYLTLIDSTTAGRFDSTSIVSGDNVELWGAQLEQRSAVSAYTPTTTQAITNYIPALQTAASGVARFDHNPTTGESLGLLVEEQRTNLLTYSEEFDNAAWTKGSSSVTANTIVAPDGTLTGDKFISNSGQTGGANVNQVISKSAVATTYAYTCYAKAGEFVSFRLYFNDQATSANRCEATFNLSTGATSSIVSAGTFSNPSASMTLVGNGWYRCVLIGTSSTETSFQTRITNASSGQTGDGYSGIYLWGAQLEAGAFPTSYIATTSASVTRNADAASMTGTNFSSWYRADEGTVLVLTNKPTLSPTGTNHRMFSIDDGSDNNTIELFLDPTASNASRFRLRVNAANQALGNGASSMTLNTTFASAFAYKRNDVQAVDRGSSAFTDTDATIPVVNRMQVGAQAGGAANFLNGTIVKLAYYPSRLSNAQLQALTTV